MSQNIYLQFLLSRFLFIQRPMDSCVEANFPLVSKQAMKFPLLKNFLFRFDLRHGGYLIGIIDVLLYGTICILFSLQNFTEWKIIDKKYGENLYICSQIILSPGFSS